MAFIHTFILNVQTKKTLVSLSFNETTPAPSLQAKVLQIVSKITPQSPQKMVVNDKQSTFCLLTQGDVVYVGNASVNISITHIFNYLRTISSAFQKKFSDVLQSPSDTSLFSSFKATISEQAKQYVEKASSAKLDELNADLEDVRTVLTKNFQDLTERGEKLDIVEEQARNLMNDSRDFKKKSQDLYNASGWNDYLPHLIIIAIVLFLLIKNMIFPSKKD